MLSMSEGKTNLGVILGSLMGMTTPMMTGLVKSILSSGMIKSMTGMISDLPGAVIGGISSIDLREILSSTVGAMVSMAMGPLGRLLKRLGPTIETLSDMFKTLFGMLSSILSFTLEIVSTLLEAAGPLLNTLVRTVSSLLG